MQDTSTYQEKELLSQLKQDDEQAFEKIYKLYSARLYGNLLKLVKTEPEAQEILQDVFMKIWDNRRSIDTNKSFRSYLFKIAENKVYDFFRKMARDKKKETAWVALFSSASLTEEELLLTDKNDAMLNSAIELLPPQRRQVFRLCKLEGKSYKEVSELLGISVSTISDHIVKATKSIRNYFEDNEQALMMLLVLSFYTSA